jgi:hypothetical protein
MLRDGLKLVAKTLPNADGTFQLAAPSRALSRGSDGRHIARGLS